MFIRYRAEGIFISKLKRFEADEYLTVFTKEFGKIGITGKSIRKIKSKLRSSSELFCYSDIEFIRGRHYNILTDSELRDDFSEIKSDLGKLSVAFQIARLLDSFLAEEEEDERLWIFARKSFFLLDDLSLSNLGNNDKKRLLHLFYYYFCFKFLEILGYKPDMGGCVLDKKEASIFSPREGGLICKNCSLKIRDPLEISLEEGDINLIESVSKMEFENFLEKDFHFEKIDEVLSNYLIVLPSRLS